MPGFLCRQQTRLLSLPLTPNQDCSGIDLMGEILRGVRSQASGLRLRVEATLVKTILSLVMIRLLAFQAGGGANLRVFLSPGDPPHRLWVRRSLTTINAVVVLGVAVAPSPTR